MRQFLFALVLSALLLPGCGGKGGGSSSGSTPPPPPPGGGINYPGGHPITWPTTDAAILSMEDQIHTLINNHRVSIPIGALTMVPLMRETARGHSFHMTDPFHSFFAHTNPEGDGPTQRYALAGGTGGCGENIAAGYTSAAAVVAGWLASPGHLANIETAGYTLTGIGYSPDAVTEPNPTPPPTNVTYFKTYTQMFQ